jgi:hypothetical protein
MTRTGYALGSSFILAGFAGVLLFGQSALAIPNQLLNPHSDAAPDISWPTPAPAAPETTNHFHLVLRAGETITQNASSISSNKNWAADSVWDDRFYRFQDTPAADGGVNALASKFGHGYIDPTFVPRYTFNNVPAAAQPILTNDFTLWNTAAQGAATAVGNKTPAGTPTKTSIAFQNVAAGNGAEFKIQFYNNFQSTQSAFAEWMPSAEQISPGSPVVAGDIIVMGYEANPRNSVNAPAGWQLRIKDTDPGTPGNQPGPLMGSFGENVGWWFNNAAPAASDNVDLEYSSDGGTTVVDQLPAGQLLSTNTFRTITGAATDVVQFFPMDFQTIALHETGHILGLLHDPSSAAGAAGNIMRSQIAFDASFGNTQRTIDGDSAYGAAILYTIPVPEPVGAALVLAFGVLVTRRRR